MRKEYTRFNLTGQQFGRLTVLYEAPQKGYVRFWHCRCICGKEKTILQSALRGGLTQSCGCYQIDGVRQRSTTHGQAQRGNRAPEYRVFLSMHQRCENPNNQQYSNYGARGISVCSRWDSFELFLADMGKRPSPKHSLDRIDNNGNYEPNNCKWATVIEQNNNKRNCVMLTHDGITQSLANWGRQTGLRGDLIRQRIDYGWSVSDALTVPLRRTKRSNPPLLS